MHFKKASDKYINIKIFHLMFIYSESIKADNKPYLTYLGLKKTF